MSKKAIQHLSKKDQTLKKIISDVGKKHGHYRFESPHSISHFQYMLRCIVYQQLSGKAANTIFNRFLALYKNNSPTPKAILKTSEEKFQSAGVSRQKRTYILDLAEKAHEELIDFDHLETLEDEKIIETLTQIKGIGVWTSQMFLMFKLGRLDVLPTLDLGIQKAVQKAYGLKKLASPKEVEKIGAAWTPYRTVASWYLWRSLDG